MAGPIYRHDPANPSTTKFPAYWDGKAFFGEYSQDYIAAFTLTKPNGPITKIENFFPNLELGSRGYRAVGRPDRPGVRSRRLALRPRTTSRATWSRVDYSPGNKRPRAAIAVDRSSGGAAPLTVAFDAGGSTDPDGDALTYEWDFDGNGTWDATGAKASFNYTTNGLYNARLRATDPSGKAGVISQGDLGRQHRADGDAAHPARRRFHRLGPRLGVPDPGLRPGGHGRDHLQPRALDDLPRPRLARAPVHDGCRLQGRRADLPGRRRARRDRERLHGARGQLHRRRRQRRGRRDRHHQGDPEPEGHAGRARGRVSGHHDGRGRHGVRQGRGHLVRHGRLGRVRPGQPAQHQQRDHPRLGHGSARAALEQPDRDAVRDRDGPGRGRLEDGHDRARQRGQRALGQRSPVRHGPDRTA